MWGPAQAFRQCELAHVSLRETHSTWQHRTKSAAQRVSLGSTAATRITSAGILNVFIRAEMRMIN